MEAPAYQFLHFCQINEGVRLADNYELIAKLEIAFASMIEGEKQKAYVVKIGNAFTVALADEESAKEVLLHFQN